MEEIMNQLFKFGLVLGIICLLATLVLAVTYEITKPKIDAQIRSEEDAALKVIMPDAQDFKKKTMDGIDYFEAMKGKAAIGYCVKVTGEGYGGYIRMMVGLDTNGVIKGVRILEHQETPGLGSKINEIAPGENDPYFLRQFIGKNARTVSSDKGIDAITGATISSRAVTDAINKTVEEFLRKVKR
jgi:electron transport complex protein RnfG